MSKFFVFRQADESVSSTRVSNSGRGISSLAVPSDSLSFISSEKGAITITFNNSNLFDSSQLTEGESVEKTNVRVSCVDGEENDLIRSILEFLSRTTTSSLLVFDSVASVSTFRQVDFSQDNSILIKVPSYPVDTITKDISAGDAEREFQTSIADINYGSVGNLPLVDYNETKVATSDGGAATAGDIDGTFAWGNSGTGGATYNIANSGFKDGGTGAGKIFALSSTTRAASGLATISATIGFETFLALPTALTLEEDYTVYFVVGYSEAQVTNTIGARNMGFIYGSNNGDCFGIQQSKAIAVEEEPKGKTDVLNIRHDGFGGHVAAETEMIDYSFPSLNSEYSDQNQVCYVFVVRRDKDFNIFVHNHLGDVVAEFPSFTDPSSQNGRTDGSLLIETIGGCDLITSPTQSKSFSGNLARFGVIEKDIGNEQAVSIAQQMFAKYNPTS